MMLLPSQAAATPFHFVTTTDRYVDTTFESATALAVCLFSFGVACPSAAGYSGGFDLNTFTFLSSSEVDSRGSSFAPAQQNVINSLSIEILLKDDSGSIFDFDEISKISVWVGSYQCDFNPFEVDDGSIRTCVLPSLPYTDWHNWGHFLIGAYFGDYEVD
jgi:hypothetical protein